MTQISKITTRRRRRRRCRLKRCCRLFLRCLHQILELGPFWAWPGGQAKPGVRFATLVPTSVCFPSIYLLAFAVALVTTALIFTPTALAVIFH